MQTEKHSFQTEISHLLNILTNSLYSDKSIFLRELISNASDAADKLKYELLLHPGLVKQEGGFEIVLEPNAKENTLTLSDNGIGMNKEDLLNNLGTIAHSGSKEFLEKITLESKKDMPLIGQFGVGFYSAFMVASKIEVITQKAGEEKAWLWTSDGKGEFEIKEAAPFGNGTKITLFLNKEDSEYLEPFRLKELVHQHSNHILVPIFLKTEKDKEQLNESKALWMQNKSNISKEQYRDFYRKISYAFDEPWATIHFSVEGRLEYTGLLFIPDKAPFNLFNPERKAHLKLYANRVFISEDVDLIPPYLRFVKGIVDTKELPLNISREILQTSPFLGQIKSALTHRILKELTAKQKDKESFLHFWKTFGPVLKEGLYEDALNREEIASLSLFYSMKKEAFISLEDYVKEMKKEQKDIFYLTGDDLEILKHHPLLEQLKARDVDVLLLTDAVDEFWPSLLQKYKETALVNVLSLKEEVLNKIPLLKKETQEKLSKEDQESILKNAKDILKEEVADVVFSDRLLKTPALLKTKGEISLRLERLMKASGQEDFPNQELVLELNPAHPLVKKLKGEKATSLLWILYNETRLMQGEQIKNPTAFIEKINDLLEG
ncbi:MAG: molecular chaperone HtpG [Alphaproteobacteria bacterium]|nr:molecular chaperone HtpG [Alphaproteobacteria bacterium]